MRSRWTGRAFCTQTPHTCVCKRATPLRVSKPSFCHQTLVTRALSLLAQGQRRDEGVTRSHRDQPRTGRRLLAWEAREGGRRWSAASSAFSGPQDSIWTLTVAAANLADGACGMRASVGRVR